VLVDRIGYILSEIFTLLMIISITKGILRLRRCGDPRPFLDQSDREKFFQPIKLTASAPTRFFRYAVIFTLVATIGPIEIVVLSQFGAAIISGVLLVTCATIVYRGLTEGQPAGNQSEPSNNNCLTRAASRKLLEMAKQTARLPIRCGR
jgi:hypothetical protein